MKISVVTPSFRASDWLKLCVASVADQDGVEVEHIVQDSMSDDGTQEWLPGDKRVRAFIEKDRGMYDAINRGLERATGDVHCYLNCDEQFLPGALLAVSACFASDPALDVVLADTIVTDGKGDYVCHRLALVPGAAGMWVRFPVLSCAVFVRKRLFQELGIRFKTDWRELSDWFWVHEMVTKGLKVRVLPRATSVFADTGSNLNLGENGRRERARKWQMAPGWVKAMRYPLMIHYRLRLLARSLLRLRPMEYAIYTLAEPQKRVVKQAGRPTTLWPGRRVGW